MTSGGMNILAHEIRGRGLRSGHSQASSRASAPNYKTAGAVLGAIAEEDEYVY